MNILRPTCLKDLIGQQNIRDCLEISINASNKKGEALPHCLFTAPPGLGKTTLSLIIAKELKTNIQIANGANVRIIKQILPYITRTSMRSILFIDEIHQLRNDCQELLFPIMEDFRLDLESRGETVSINLEPFTLIGATTNSGKLSEPFIDRFPIKHYLEVYNDDDITKLIKLNSEKLKQQIDNDAALYLAQNSKGVPRIANNLLKWVCDFCVAKQFTSITYDIVKNSLNMLGIKDGLNKQDRLYLNVLQHFKCPIGLKTLASSTNISIDTIENQIEPFLLRKKLIMKTNKGRILYNG